MIKLPNTPHHKLIAFLLVAFTFVLYGNTINHGYNMDDELVTRNHRLTSQGISAIPEIFTSPFYQDEMGYAYEYRPIVLTSFAIEHSLFGESPQVSHFLNVLLYAFTAVFLYWLLLQLFAHVSYVFPLIVTILFIAHPVHTEVVASIKNRDEILSLLGGILAWRYALVYSMKKYWSYLLAALFFFLFGILSKLSVVPFAFLIPVSIAMFSEPDKKQLLLLSLFLALITMWILPLQNVILHVLIFVSTIALPQLTLAIKNSSFDLKKMRFGKEFSFFQSDEMFGKKIFIGFLGVIIFFILFGFLLQFPTLIELALVVAVIPFFLNNNPAKYLSVSVFLTIPVLGLAYYELIFSLQYFLGESIIAFIFFLLFFSVLYDKKSIKVYGGLILLFAPYLILSGYWFLYTIYPIFFAVFYFRDQLRPVLFKALLSIIVALFLISLVLKLLFIDGSLITESIVLILLSSIVLVKYKLAILKTALAVLFVYIFLLFQFDFSPISSVSHYSQTDIIQSPSAQFAVDRPIEYVEIPVSNADPQSVRIATSADILLNYLRLIVFPHPLGFYYGYAFIEPGKLNNPLTILSLFLHLALLIVAIFLFKKHRIASFGVLFYLISISVYSNYFYQVAGGMADRLTYVASLGFCIAFVYLLFSLTKTPFQFKHKIILSKSLTLILTVILIAYSYQTISRNALWENSYKLFSHDIGYLDKSAQAHNLLAMSMMQKSFQLPSMREQREMQLNAIEHFKRSLQIYPEFFNVHYDLGRAYMLVEQWQNALHSFEFVMQKDPTFADAYFESAMIHEFLGNKADAERLYWHIIETTPSYSEAYFNLGSLFFNTNQMQKALEVSLKAVQNLPQNYEAHLNLGVTYYSLGRYQEAIHALQNAYNLNQHNYDILMGLASSYEMTGNQQQAQYYYNLSRQHAPR